MWLVVLVLLLAGFIGTILSFFNIAIHAYREQGPLWGLLCLFVPGGNVVWGIVHWNDAEARALFVRYLACGGAVVLGMILNKASS
jgi:hypothetical protein